MGPKRLILLFALLGCSGKPSAVAPGAGAAPQHAQVFMAMKTPERRRLVERFRERNGRDWTVNDDALERSLTVVDPFRGFLRRASRAPRASRVGSEAEALDLAYAFVKKNGDLLGLTPAMASALREDVTSKTRPFIVHFDGRFATKGFESFQELENKIDLDVVVDGDVVAIVNRSRIHPRLTLDQRPLLSSEDPRLLRLLVGRSVFAVTGESEPRERIPLGELHAADLTRVELVVHVSAGPQLAWVVYRLAYLVEFARPMPGEPWPSIDPAAVHFFRYVVDADSGEVLEESRAPVVDEDSELPSP